MRSEDFQKQIEEAKSYQDIVDACHQQLADEITEGGLPAAYFRRPSLHRFMVPNPDQAALFAAKEEVQKIINRWAIEAVVVAIEMGNRTGLEVISSRWLTATEDEELPAVIQGFPVSTAAVVYFDRFRHTKKPSADSPEP